MNRSWNREAVRPWDDDWPGQVPRSSGPPARESAFLHQIIHLGDRLLLLEDITDAGGYDRHLQGIFQRIVIKGANHNFGILVDFFLDQAEASMNSASVKLSSEAEMLMISPRAPSMPTSSRS